MIKLKGKYIQAPTLRMFRRYYYLLPYSLRIRFRNRHRDFAISSRVLRACHRLQIILVLASFIAASCQGEQPDLTQKSLEDLMNIEVTSVAKKEQKTSQAAAAVFVISSDEIRRSGALNIPDLLRMVPGIEVAQLNGSVWAISARGFNGQESNKLLVLIDGRTVYNPIFAGVFWDSQIVPLASIERIEIIRGPGAAVWGANAVNGVINIITKSAKDTQGTYAVVGGGSLGAQPETMRFGAKAGNLGAYRVYVEGFHTVAQRSIDGGNGEDDWSLAHGGFRTDLKISSKDSVMAEGDLYRGDAGELVVAPVSIEPPITSTLALRDQYSGWNLLSRWTRTISANSETSLQIYFDRTSRGDTTYSLGLNTFDVDFQHHLGWGTHQDLVWGLGSRISSNGTDPEFRISFQPENRNLALFSSFVQDEIATFQDHLHTTVGVRLEHNSYTGFDTEPSISMVWAPNNKTMFWSAISGANRTPARSDRDIRVNVEALPGPNGLPLLVSYFGNPNQKNEHVTAFEAGYRKTISKDLSLDATAFYNRYRDLQSVEPGAIQLETNPAPPHLLLPWTFANGLYGEAHGFEAFANWKPTRAWTLNPGYSFLTTHIHRFVGSEDVTEGPDTEGGAPKQQAELRSRLDISRGWQWNTLAYFVDRLPALSVPAYTRLDTNLTWQLGERLSMTLAGQNLLQDRHLEYAGPDSSVQSGEIRRNGYAKIEWSF